MNKTSGIILVDKEEGFTSFDVVAVLRKILGTKKVGHTGTLDPMATGILPVCFGKATKLSQMFTDKDKCYEATMLLGVVTDTLDMTGTIQKECHVTVSEKQVAEALLSFVGGYDQLPPMYSAKKINGKKLYEYARAGVEVERTPVFVEIYDLTILSVNLPEVSFRVRCSKGTYIRSLISDVGEKLGCGASMSKLRRLKAGPFFVEDALTLEQLSLRKEEGTLNQIVYGMDSLFSYEKIVLPGHLDKMGENGNKLPVEEALEQEPEQSSPRDFGEDQRVLMYLSDGRFLGLYKRKGEFFSPEKILLEQE